MSSSLRASRVDDLLLLQLHSPDGLPRLTRSVVEELDDELARAAAEARPRGIVVTGTEQAFAVGASLEEVGALDALEGLRFAALGQRLLRRVETSPAPVVAAIRGHCLGGGFDLAMACHLRIAARDARFGHPGGSLGLITGWGGTQRLPRLIGPARAMDLLASGRIVTADEAYAVGLVSAVVAPQETLPTALARAGQPKRVP